MKEKQHALTKLLTISVTLLALTLFPAISAAGAETPPANQLAESEPQIISLLPASEFRIVDETIVKLHMTCRPATLLFDEQSTAPTVAGIGGTKPTGVNWQPLYTTSWGLTSCYIDLGAEYYISNVELFDNNNESHIILQMGTPFDWTTVGTQTTDWYRAWRNVTVNNGEGYTTRYVRIVSSGADSGISEVALYGYKVADTEEPSNVRQPTAEPLNLTSGQKIGACGFCDDPLDVLGGLGNLRDYYNWSWVVSADGESFTFNRLWPRDSLYTDLKNMGVPVIPCVQGSAEVFTQEGETFSNISNTIPVFGDADTEDPASYALHAEFMYNMAARYGSNTNINPSTLMTTDQVVGLDLISAIESWNEENKDWETKDSYFSPYEYAAMLSADWDGHEGTIENAGVKTADPNMLLAMGGTAGSGSQVISYLELMKHWFDYNREDGEFCADIINVHEYITDEEAPEDSSFRENLRALSAWIDENIPGRELWLSEFDVLTTDMEVAGVDNHDNEEYAQARAERLLRAFLVAEREGTDISSMFMTRDTSGGGVYSNSGLTTEKGLWEKKDSWYYVSCASDVLSNADLVSYYESDDLYIYTYQDRSSSEMIYAIWSPTADGSSISGYCLPVGNVYRASVTTPTYGLKEGEKLALDIVDGTVTVDVTETPIFVRTSQKDVAPENYPVSLIPVQALRLGAQHGSITTVFYDNQQIVDLNEGSFTPTESELNEDFMLSQFYKLFDEQDAEHTPATPWLSNSLAPTTQWHAQRTAVAKRQSFPYDCIITFDDYYDLSFIALFDTYNVGKLEFYNDETGELIYSSALNAYNYWNMIPLSADAGNHVNRIRIVKYNTANLNEIAFYGFPSDSKVGVETEKVAGDINIAVDSGFVRKDVVSVSVGPLTQAKYPSNVNTITNNYFGALFDEQAIAPADTEHTISEVNPFSSKFGTIWGKTPPLDAIISFDGVQTISKIAIMNEWGNASGSITLQDMNGNDLGTYSFHGKNTWHVIDLNQPITTDQLVIIKNDWATLSEIAFYGS